MEQMGIRVNRLVLFASFVGVLFACARYEWVPDGETEACGNRRVEPAVPIPAPHFIASTASKHDSLPGFVFLNGSNKPTYSEVRVYAPTPISTMTDSMETLLSGHHRGAIGPL